MFTKDLAIIKRQLYCHSQSLKLSTELNDYSGICKSFASLGLDYYKFNECEKAIEHYEQALAISRERGEQQSRISHFNRIRKHT